MSEEKTHEEELLENAQIGAGLVRKCLLEQTPMTDRIRMASQSIGQYQRFLGTKGVFQAMNFSIARAIAKDRDELKKIIGEVPKLPK